MRSKPFDLTLLDYDAQRRTKRRKLLIWSIPAVIVAFALGLWLVAPQLLTGRAISGYKHGNFGSARSWITPLTWTSPEPFVAAFNSGTIDSAQEKYDRAERELTRALAIAPPAKRCMTAQNLVLTLTNHINKSKSDPKAVTTLTKQSNAIMQANSSCFKGGSSGGGGGSSSSSADDSQSPSDSQQQQLQQKEQAGSERQAQYAREETYNPDDPSIKPW